MIYIDMDGVLVDFNKRAFEVHNKKYEEVDSHSLEKIWDINSREFWDPINKLGNDFWANLEPFSWFKELIKMCSPNFCIATSPSLSHYAAGGKVQSIQKLFGKSFRKYHITPQKWELGKPGNILIDDLESNCEKFEQAGGSAILFPQKYNYNYLHINYRMEFVESQLKQLELVGAVNGN